MQRTREGGEQDGLPHGHDRCAEKALGDPVCDQRLQAVGEPAQQRGDREAHDREEEQVAPAQPVGEPAGHRRGDGGGDQVRRDDPGDLIGRRRHGALDLRQHDIDQRNGHAEQQRRQRHRHQDQPLPRRNAR